MPPLAPPAPLFLRYTFVFRFHHLSIIPTTEGYSCEFGSAKYFALCGFGGILACGLTHTAMVPLDLVKTRIQVSSGRVIVFATKKHCVQRMPQW